MWGFTRKIDFDEVASALLNASWEASDQFAAWMEVVKPAQDEKERAVLGMFMLPLAISHAFTLTENDEKRKANIESVYAAYLNRFRTPNETQPELALCPVVRLNGAPHPMDAPFQSRKLCLNRNGMVHALATHDGESSASSRIVMRFVGRSL